MERDSFIFYRSFAEALNELPDEIYLEVSRAIINFALTGKEPKLSGVGKAIFSLIKPQIMANNIRYDNGKKGGRNKNENKPNENQNETETEPKANQGETKAEPNENENVNVNENVNENEKVSKKESKKEERDIKNNNERVRESYDEIFSDMDVDEIYKEALLRFIKHLKVNFGTVMMNDRLVSLIVRLDGYYRDDAEKIKAIDDAIIKGYRRLDIESRDEMEYL